MSEQEITALLTYLAVEKHVAASAQNQALSVTHSQVSRRSVPFYPYPDNRGSPGGEPQGALPPNPPETLSPGCPAVNCRCYLILAVCNKRGQRQCSSR